MLAFPGRALRLWGRRWRIDTPVSYAFLAGNRVLSVLVDIFKGTSGRAPHQERPDLAAGYRKKGFGVLAVKQRRLVSSPHGEVSAPSALTITNAPSTLAREAAMQLVRNAEDCASNIQCMTW